MKIVTLNVKKIRGRKVKRLIWSLLAQGHALRIVRG
jgi:hypothetical protein